MQGDNDNDSFDPSTAEDVTDNSEMESAKETAKVAVQAVERSRNRTSNVPDEIFEISDLSQRALVLRRNTFFDFKHGKANDMQVFTPDPKSDRNYDDFYDVLFDKGSNRCPYPFFDTFRGMLVAHNGDALNEFTMPTSEIADAMEAAGLKNVTYMKVDDSYKRWAGKWHRNSMIERMEKNTPVWDGQPRIHNYLINLFKLRDTYINRLIGRYFWLSLYNRVVNPGAQAPLSIALIGDQDVGKSYFSVLTCQTLMGNKDSGPVPLGLNDIERGQIAWFRRMTGMSIIANIGELKGFRQADLNTIKDFATRATDDFDHKYQSSIAAPRQWILILDGNSYDGFQRDETGNRRFFPMFCNQIEDNEDGQPQWAKDGWKADFSTYPKDLWQIMAECREFMAGTVNKHAYFEEIDEKSMLISKGIITPEEADALPDVEGNKHAYFISEEEKSMLIKAENERVINTDIDIEKSMLILSDEEKACLLLAEQKKKHAYFDGKKEYARLVGMASKATKGFSDEEMSRGSGIIRDDSTEAALRRLVLMSEFVVIDRKLNSGCFLTNSELQFRWNKEQKGSINFASVKRIMTAMGFECITVKPHGRGYMFKGVLSVREAKRLFWLGGTARASEVVDSSVDTLFDSALSNANSESF